MKKNFIRNLKVYYNETDSSGAVYHTSYIKWAERARTDFLHKLGISYIHLENVGLKDLFMVKKIKVDYIKPAFLEDNLRVVTSIKKIARTFIVFDQLIYKTQICDELSLLIKIEVKVACVKKGKATLIPDFLKEKFIEFK